MNEWEDSSSVEEICTECREEGWKAKKGGEGRVGPPRRVSSRDGQPIPFAVKTMGQ